jgi:hypothetical protein
MSAGGERPAVPDLAALGRGAWGTFVHGPSRPVLLRVLFAMATANDPSPIWVDLRGPDNAPDLGGPAELGWIPDHNLFIVSASDARPQDAMGNLALWTMIRSDEPDAAVSQLTDFLRLPSAVQEAVSRAGGAGARPMFVVANSDRVRDYYPRDARGVRPIIDAMIHSGVLPLFGSTSPPGAGRMAFDFVFEVRAAGLDEARAGVLFCEKAPPHSGFPEGSSHMLSSFPAIAAALDAQPSRATF